MNKKFIKLLEMVRRETERRHAGEARMQELQGAKILPMKRFPSTNGNDDN